MIKYKFEHGDVLEVLKTYESESFHGCFCDPPYGYKFMGKEWDHGVPSKEVWGEVLRVLKPGAFLLAYGGSRTHHRLMVNIEDAGFEIRDCLMWLYGSGFPKSHDISKAIDKAAGMKREIIGPNKWQHIMGERPKDETTNIYGRGQTDNRWDTAAATEEAKIWEGYGTALKPSWEPCIVAMKPVEGNFVENALKHDVAGLNIDCSRIGVEITGWNGNKRSKAMTGDERIGKALGMFSTEKKDHIKTELSGRWPANLILDEETEEMLNKQSGPCKVGELTGQPRNNNKNVYGDAGSTLGKPMYHMADEPTGAARFFYCAKVDTEEREAGISGFKQVYGQSNGAKSAIERGEMYEKSDNGMNKTKIVRNPHPTVKPKDLNKYFAKMMLPPQGHRRIIIPFSGVGSELIGAILAGWDEAVGIEMDASYIEIAQQRCKRWLPELFTDIS